MSKSTRNRILDPLERFSEIVFGLIMVLTFTCAMSVAEVGVDDVRTMLVGAIGCNLAWAIIDAAFYLIACLAEDGHNIMLLRKVQNSGDPKRNRTLIAAHLPPKIAEALQPDDFDRIAEHLKQIPAPRGNVRLQWENWVGAFGVFLLVFLSTFPVVVPFLIWQNAKVALHVSNGVAITLLFGSGYMLARYSGMPRVLTGLLMVLVGMILVGFAIALGG